MFNDLLASLEIAIGKLSWVCHVHRIDNRKLVSGILVGDIQRLDNVHGCLEKFRVRKAGQGFESPWTIYISLANIYEKVLTCIFKVTLVVRYLWQIITLIPRPAVKWTITEFVIVFRVYLCVWMNERTFVNCYY